MPKRRKLSRILFSTDASSTVVVIDDGLARALQVPVLSLDELTGDQVHLQLTAQATALENPPAWLIAFREWILRARPTVISLSPATVVDSVMYGDIIAPQSYGFGTPAHVPALFKPNGSLNWFRFLNNRIPTSIRGFYPLQRDGLACHSGRPCTPFKPFADTSPAIDASRDTSSSFQEIWREARRRLLAASEVLLLGLDPMELRESDRRLLNQLSPTRRVTLVNPCPATANALHERCELKGMVEVEVGDLQDWVGNRLVQWDSV